MKNLFAFVILLFTGSVFADPPNHHHPKPHPKPHPQPHLPTPVPHPDHLNKGPVHPHPVHHDHFRQPGVSHHKFGYVYKGHTWNFWRGHKFIRKYGCWCNWNPYTHCWYYWCNPAGCWYPLSHCPYGVYSWEDSPDDDGCEVDVDDDDYDGDD